MGFRDELRPIVEAEMDITAQVATLMSQGYRKTEVMALLGISQAEYQISVQRLQSLAHKWSGGIVFLDV